MFQVHRFGGSVVPDPVLAEVLAARFTLDRTEVEPGCVEVKVAGELDLAVSDRLRGAIESCRGEVLIDLEACRFMDSSGVAVILAVRRRGARVVVHGARGQVLRILELTGLTDEGVVCSDRDHVLRPAPDARIGKSLVG